MKQRGIHHKEILQHLRLNLRVHHHIYKRFNSSHHHHTKSNRVTRFLAIYLYIFLVSMENARVQFDIARLINTMDIAKCSCNREHVPDLEIYKCSHNTQFNLWGSWAAIHSIVHRAIANLGESLMHSIYLLRLGIQLVDGHKTAIVLQVRTITRQVGLKSSHTQPCSCQCLYCQFRPPHHL